MSDLLTAFRRIERPHGGFRLAIADPPWLIKMRSEKGEEKSPQRHYRCYPIEDIAFLPVSQIMATDSLMLLWGTAPMLDQQLWCLKTWGFDYISFAPWFKGSPRSSDIGPDDEDWKPSFGGGYIFRNCSEILLIGRRGSPKLLPQRRSLRAAFFDPVREHSRKPDAQYSHAEALSPGPYIEIFSRTNRPNWTSFGDQVGKYGTATS